MLSDEPEVWRMATGIAQKHGEDALRVVIASADGALTRRAFGEYLVWLDILDAVMVLSAQGGAETRPG